MSGGQRQRVAIARALSLNPDAIIADEPTSALDVSVRAQILNLLMDLKKQLGLAMVFISHDIQTVRYISDRIIVMNHGQAVERGTAEEVFNHPKDDYTRLLLGAAPRFSTRTSGKSKHRPARTKGDSQGSPFLFARDRKSQSQGWMRGAFRAQTVLLAQTAHWAVWLVRNCARNAPHIHRASYGVA